jgi:hypothetical protein
MIVVQPLFVIGKRREAVFELLELLDLVHFLQRPPSKARIY